jgi:hypothetical protein
MSTFDPMAVAIDWLDAYRAGSLSILDFYAPNAAVECGCSAIKVRLGQAAITEYWIERFAEKPAGELVEFQPAGDGIVVAYKVDVDEFVRATLYFDHEGKIARSVCGPATPRGNSAYSISMTAIKLLTEHLERAISLERLAADEQDPQFKDALLGQAAAYRKLAAKRASDCGLPPPSPPENAD